MRAWRVGDALRVGGVGSQSEVDGCLGFGELVLWIALILFVAIDVMRLHNKSFSFLLQDYVLQMHRQTAQPIS